MGDTNVNPTHAFDLNSAPYEDEHVINLNYSPFEEEDVHMVNSPEEHGDFHPNYAVNESENHINMESLNDQEENQGQTNRKHMLSNGQREAIYRELLSVSIDGIIKRGVTNIIASQFLVPIQTVQRIWKQGKASNGNVSTKKMKNCGRKRIQIDMDQIANIPLRNRQTIRSLASALNIGATQVFYLFKSGGLRRHTNPIKPLLTEANKRSRLLFCLSMLDQTSLPDDPKFQGMYNMIHIDEKWFYITQVNAKYYLTPTEENPLRTCKSKNFILKVMFLVAMARPRFDEERNITFSGKLGVFPFTVEEVAIRSSVNRVAGTLETKPITSVKRVDIKSFLINKVIPAIKRSWPREDSSSPIFIQQDNARTHINPNDEDFRHAATQDGFDIRIMCQPTNSPDLNVLDLGFFSAIQSLMYKEVPRNVDELLAAVHKSFEDFETVKSNRIFLSLQLSMIETMKLRGDNNYSIPHINKAMLEREGRLPVVLKCDRDLLQAVSNYLNQECTNGVQ